MDVTAQDILIVAMATEQQAAKLYRFAKMLDGTIPIPSWVEIADLNAELQGKIEEEKGG